MSYHEYWSLRRAPFSSPDCVDAFFAGRPQREAIARLEYLIGSGQGSGLLISPTGCGRSTLLRRAATSSGFGDCAVDVALTHTSQHGSADALQSLAAQLGIREQATPLWRAVCDRVRAAGRQHVRTLWLIDDATTEVAEMAAALASESRAVTVVAVTQPRRAAALAVAFGACPLRLDLEPLELQDTVAYVNHALAVAGAPQAIFSDSAIVRLHELGEGRIAVIARLAELALLAGAAHQVGEIQAELVEAIQDELIRAA